ncbi:MAG TPA: hypothetical protein VF092_18120 [Longimicrobium sp.]
MEKWRALQSSLGEQHVEVQVFLPLGRRNGRRLVVTPDVSYRGDAMVIIDAKYRARRTEARTRIAAADAYAALAFMHAAGAKRTLLLYPRVPRGGTSDPPGSGQQFEQIEVGEAQIMGLEVECLGIAADGFQTFAERLAHAVEPFLR